MLDEHQSSEFLTGRSIGRLLRWIALLAWLFSLPAPANASGETQKRMWIPDMAGKDAPAPNDQSPLSENRLPHGTVIHFKELNLWDRYK